MKPLHILLIIASVFLFLSAGRAMATSTQSNSQRISDAYDMFVKARAEKSVEKMIQAITILDKEMPAKSQLTADQGPDMVDVFIKELKAQGGHYERKPKPKTRGIGSTLYNFIFNCVVLDANGGMLEGTRTLSKG